MIEEYKLLVYPQDWPLVLGDECGWGNWTDPFKTKGHSWVKLNQYELTSHNPIDKPAYSYRRKAN